MVRAYVFVESSKGRQREIAETLLQLPRIKATDVITGQFDVIARIEAEDLSDLWETVDKIQAVQGVTKTTTNIVVE